MWSEVRYVFQIRIFVHFPASYLGDIHADVTGVKFYTDSPISTHLVY